MSLDKTNLLNSEDSSADPSMTEHVSTSDGEAIDDRIAKGPKWTQILKQEGETYNIVNRRLILAISRKRFTEEDCEQSKWIRDIRDTLDRVSRPSNSNVSYRPEGRDPKKRQSKYDVDDRGRYNEPESLQVLNGRKSAINGFDSGDDVELEDFENNQKPSANKTRSGKGRDRAQETLSRFSQAASAIEPSEDGGLWGRSHKSKTKLYEEEDTYRHY